MSAFFQNIDSLFPKGAYKEKSSEELIATFMEKYSHNVSINWFENEFKKTLGIDICEFEVDKNMGFFRFERNGISCLLLKVEANDNDKENALIDFIGCGSDFKLLKTNIGDEKSYAEQYKDFKSKIIIPEEYLDKMYGSRLIQSFYTEESINKMRSKWIRG